MNSQPENQPLKSDEIPSKDSEPLVKRDEKGRVLPGSILNPVGSVKGSRHFETDFNEVVEEIAQANNITFSEARKILIKKAYAEAKNGKYLFYKDIQDRIYGQATHKISGDPDNPLVLQIINYDPTKNNNNSLPIPAEELPAIVPSEPVPVQNSGVASEIGKEQNSPQPTDPKKPA